MIRSAKERPELPSTLPDVSFPVLIPQDLVLVATQASVLRIRPAQAEKESLLPKLEGLRKAIGDMTAHYDAKLAEVPALRCRARGRGFSRPSGRTQAGLLD